MLLPYDLTRNGGIYSYFGHTDMKELALYIQDQIKAGNWMFNLGIRGDLYNGLSIARQAEPRLGTATHQEDEHGVAGLVCADAGEVRSTRTWCCRARAAGIRC